MDVLAIGLFVKFFNIATWLNYGPFGVWGLPFFPPIAWTCFFILYFYLIPKYKPWNYIFALFGAGYSVLFATILENLGILSWNYSRTISQIGVYLPWFIAATWGYFRITGYSKVTNNRNNLFGLSPVPASKLRQQNQKYNQEHRTYSQEENMRTTKINKPKVMILKTKEKRPSLWKRIKNRLVGLYLTTKNLR